MTNQPLVTDQQIDNYANGIFFADDVYEAAKVRMEAIRAEYEQRIAELEAENVKLGNAVNRASTAYIELVDRIQEQTT